MASRTHTRKAEKEIYYMCSFSALCYDVSKKKMLPHPTSPHENAFDSFNLRMTLG